MNFARTKSSNFQLLQSQENFIIQVKLCFCYTSNRWRNASFYFVPRYMRLSSIFISSLFIFVLSFILLDLLATTVPSVFFKLKNIPNSLLKVHCIFISFFNFSSLFLVRMLSSTYMMLFMFQSPILTPSAIFQRSFQYTCRMYTYLRKDFVFEKILN